MRIYAAVVYFFLAVSFPPAGMDYKCVAMVNSRSALEPVIPCCKTAAQDPRASTATLPVNGVMEKQCVSLSKCIRRPPVTGYTNKTNPAPSARVALLLNWDAFPTWVSSAVRRRSISWA